MKKLVAIKPFTFYLWLALVYFLLSVVHSLGTYPGRFFPVVINNFWGIIYVTVLNYLLFEYSVPYVLRRRKFIISNILLGILFLWIYMMLYSYGSYLWRKFGVQVGVYIPLKEFGSLKQGLANRMEHSVGSVFLFGIIRHIYNYIKLKQSAQQLRIEKQAAELNYLKSQTNPHFLFNTLNNIYSLARDKSDLAPESILRLSKILRFMLV